MSLKRYRMKAKHLKRKPKSMFDLGFKIGTLMNSKSARRRLKRYGGYAKVKNIGNMSHFLYIPPTPTKEEEYEANYRCRKCDGITMSAIRCYSKEKNMYWNWYCQICDPEGKNHPDSKNIVYRCWDNDCVKPHENGYGCPIITNPDWIINMQVK